MKRCRSTLSALLAVAAAGFLACGKEDGKAEASETESRAAAAAAAEAEKRSSVLAEVSSRLEQLKALADPGFTEETDALRARQDSLSRTLAGLEKSLK
jgi:hypothetical protein